MLSSISQYLYVCTLHTFVYTYVSECLYVCMCSQINWKNDCINETEIKNVFLNVHYSRLDKSWLRILSSLTTTHMCIGMCVLCRYLCAHVCILVYLFLHMFYAWPYVQFKLIRCQLICRKCITNFCVEYLINRMRLCFTVI